MSTDGIQSAADEPAAGGLGVTLRALYRTVTVLRQFLPLVVAYLRDRRRFVLVGGRREVTAADQRRRARYLLETLVDLGPAFIKFGQILSTRPDALPRAYVDVLSELQDEVPPDDWATVRPVVERELGPVEERFATFDTEPISGASLGQVYTAEVAASDVDGWDGEAGRDGRNGSSDGTRKVAVKVLRPGIRERVEADLRVIGTLLPGLVRFAPEGQAYTLENLADEFAATIREEMDYDHEAAMLRTIGESFTDDPGVAVPDYLPGHSTDRVLTMEYVGGTKITDVDALESRGVDPTELVERLERVYIEMILEHGRFHADPHPGNLAVQDDGTIVFYDFGMTGRLGPETREHLFEFYVALAEDDVDAVIDAFVAMDALDPAADRELMREVFDIAIEQFRGEDLDRYRIEELIGEFQGELYDFPMRLPRDLALVVRVTTVLDGVCRTLDPEFDFIAVVSDYVREQGYAREGARRLVEGGVADLRGSVRAALRLPPEVEDAAARITRDDLVAETRLRDESEVVERLARRLLFGLVLAVDVVLVSLLFAFLGPREAGIAGLAGLVAAGLLYRSFRRRRGIRARPQFTRQNLRNRRGGE